MVLLMCLVASLVHKNIYDLLLIKQSAKLYDFISGHWSYLTLISLKIWQENADPLKILIYSWILCFLTIIEKCNFNQISTIYYLRDGNPVPRTAQNCFFLQWISSVHNNFAVTKTTQKSRVLDGFWDIFAIDSYGGSLLIQILHFPSGKKT